MSITPGTILFNGKPVGIAEAGEIKFDGHMVENTGTQPLDMCGEVTCNIDGKSLRSLNRFLYDGIRETAVPMSLFLAEASPDFIDRFEEMVVEWTEDERRADNRRRYSKRFYKHEPRRFTVFGEYRNE